MNLSRCFALVVPSVALMLGTNGAIQAQFVTNGSFESTSNGPNFQFDLSTTATGWTSTNANSNAYNFIYSPGAADTTGATGSFGNVQMWGPGNGSANGLPATSPDGGNYVAADGAFQNGAISQTITGLTTGNHYFVSFWWAGAQQMGFDGATTEQWQVSLGGQTLLTPVVNVANHGFSGWTLQTLEFTADSANPVLSFFAIGTPNGGVPPFALLDGVTLSAVPEPSTLAMIGFGVASAGIYVYRRRALLAKANATLIEPGAADDR